jgi:hypothetical protein
MQRGGIHSEPAIRLLAFRRWGNRDRHWRKRDTAIAVVEMVPDNDDKLEVWRRAYGFDDVAMYQDDWKSVIEYRATRDGREALVQITIDRALHAEAAGGEERIS